MSEKCLPVGIQDFEKFHTGNFIYVDKTPYIYEMVKPAQGFYFLSRPRRFGKSLLVSTLKYLFEGRRDLFKNSWIANNTNWKFDSNPVMTFDFNGINHENPKELRKDLLSSIQLIAEQHKIKLLKNSLPMQLKNGITALRDSCKKTVVVLIDEYDKPIISHIGKGERELTIARENREILKQFFGVLKEQSVSSALRFVFLTGVSKFSQVSIFSDLNNLNDISLQEKYATILGYTQKELEHYFNNHIDTIIEELKLGRKECLEKLQVWYNGYSFTAAMEKVYNPFSILNALHTKTFKNYWFETGTPSFLVNLIKEYDYPIAEIENLHLDISSFSTFDIDDLKLEALLFQTGYITLSNFDQVLYTLNYPNQEVKSSFLNYLYHNLISIKSSAIKDSFKLIAVYLGKNSVEKFIETTNTILSSIPYTQIANQDESYYHTVFYLILSASGVEVQTEVLTSKGRIDIAVFLEDTLFIIELKCNQSANDAIKQIKTKGYTDRYKNTGKKIRLMGINFDTDRREITDWKVE